MDTVVDYTDSNDIFTDRKQVEQYAQRRGRRELEVALTSGCLSPRSERVIGEWLALDDARRRRRESLPLWLYGVLAAGLVAGVLAWLV